MIAIPTSAVEAVLNLACTIQQIPAPTFSEEKRARWVSDQFQESGLLDVQTDRVGNVLARLPGREHGKPVIVSAHMDSVFPEPFPLTLDRQRDCIVGPGIGDNALGLATLVYLAPLFHELNLHPPGDLWLVGTVGEEGLGNLRGIQEITTRFADTAACYISLEGLGLGNVLHRGLGVERLRFSARTAGGHSWVDYGAPSAVHELVKLAERLLKVRIPRKPRSSLNIGVVQGGTSVNTIAAAADMDVDIRSEGRDSLNSLVDKAVRLAHQTHQPNVKITVDRIGTRPAGEIPKSHPLVYAAGQVLRDMNITPCFDIASTEANFPLSLGYPAVTLGLTTGNHAHTAQEYIDTAPVEKGLQQIIALLVRLTVLSKISIG